jgi:ubiquinone/menaquinone biosynthesis C-methylase UbiE
MFNFFGKSAGRGDEPHRLVVDMTGVRLGERVAQIGCPHGGRLAAIAKKVGLSGRALAIVPDEASAARASKGAAQAGVLVEIETAPATRLPAEDAAFDLVVVDETGGLLATMASSDRAATVREMLRLLRPGGRAIVIGRARRGGVRGMLARGPAAPLFDAAPTLQANGFKTVRHLAERDGLVFVEGIKPRQA